MTNPTALIIEDEVELSEIFADVLQGDGFVTEIVRDGQTAYDLLATSTPDFVLLDMHLPRVSGLDILALLRTEPRLANTKVMIVTADVFLAKLVADKADVVLVKPVTADDISRHAARLLGRDTE